MFSSVSNVKYTYRANLLSVIPVAGQIIGVSTIAINTTKVGYDCLAVMGCYCTKKGVDRQVALRYRKERFKQHTTYIGIGLVRAMPIVGGYALYMTNTAPRIKRVWTNVGGALSKNNVMRSMTSSIQKRRVVNLTLAMPVLGQVVGLGLVAFHVGNIVCRVLWLADLTLMTVIARLFIATKRIIVFPFVKKHDPILEPMQDFEKAMFNSSLLSIHDSMAEASIALTATLLPIVGGATFYAADTHRHRDYKYNNDNNIVPIIEE